MPPNALSAVFPLCWVLKHFSKTQSTQRPARRPQGDHSKTYIDRLSQCSLCTLCCIFSMCFVVKTSFKTMDEHRILPNEHGVKTHIFLLNVNLPGQLY